MKRMRRTIRCIAVSTAAFAAAAAILFAILNSVYPLPAGKLTRSPSAAVFSKDGRLMNVFLAEDDRWRMWSGLDSISPFLVDAVVSYEDRWFFSHPGINPYSLIRAAMVNLRSGRVVSGGSTITMQIARMMEPKGRTYRAKLIEIFRALQIEARYSKREILELYLNMAPYGGNIEGVAAASYFYFGKSPGVISRSEAVSLVILPNSPTRLRPDRNPGGFRLRREEIAKRLLKSGLIEHGEYEGILSGELPGARTVPPSFAPHFSRMVKSLYKDRANIDTTIDTGIQWKCEKALSQHLAPLIPIGITNGAIVVIENSSRKVRAMVGSRDFYDTFTSGQVNGATSPRSPGSALKPFAYALALENGQISPRLMIPDVPVRYGDYSPVNYDEKHRGGVPAEEALKLSLNVPAVNIVAGLKGGFYSFLKEGGISTLTFPGEHYGLSLILGGGEVALLDLTNLYSTLANGGMHAKPVFIESGESVDSRRILSEGAAYIISEILSDVRRPDLPNCWEFTTSLPKVAWKTGTSYGHRDAWSIGYNPDYTVGVWIGNFSGEEADRLIGSEVAAPLLFDIFNTISDGSRWFAKPASVGTRKVCSLSGMPVNEDCPHSVDELFLYGKSPSRQCNMHRTVLVDAETGFRISKSCIGDKAYRKKLFTIWPPGIGTWMRRQGFPVDRIPPQHKDCLQASSGQRPIILSPQNDMEYFIRSGTPLEYQKIMLDASVSNTVSELYWFVDGEMLAAAAPREKQFLLPGEGKHRIVCMEAEGRTSLVSITVVR